MRSLMQMEPVLSYSGYLRLQAWISERNKKGQERKSDNENYILKYKNIFFFFYFLLLHRRDALN